MFNLSDEILAPAITGLVLLLLFLWVPSLHLCHGCVKRLALMRNKPGYNSTQPTVAEETEQAA